MNIPCLQAAQAVVIGIYFKEQPVDVLDPCPLREA